MKRLQERDTPPKNKRSRTNYNDPDDRDRDRLSPDLDRREGRPPGKHASARDQNCQKNRRDRSVPVRDSGRDYEPDLPKRRQDDRPLLSEPYPDLPPREKPVYSNEYRTLCVSNLHPRVDDNSVKEALFKEFEIFGDFNVKVVRNGDFPRIAFINFRFADNAREAKRGRPKLILFDMPLRIEAVFNKSFNKRPRVPSPDLYPVARDPYPRSSVSPPPPPGRRLSRNTPDMVVPAHPPPESDFPPSFDDPNWSGGYQQQSEPKFPHHLHHIQPEDDDKATRTLFVGNLDYDITEEELEEVFCRYGTLEAIDIKHPMRGLGNAYAFVKFINLDMAHRAKLKLSGEYIGKYQCKIGYGKALPSMCLWIGGLGPWVSIETLHQELDRFGVIRQIEWPRDKNYAYVLFDSNDAASAACQGLRGVSLGGRNHRLRVDFADPEHIVALPPRYQPNSKPRNELGDAPPEFNDEAGGQGRGYGGGQWNKRYNGRGRTSQRNDWTPQERTDYRNVDNAPRNRRWNRNESSFGNDNPGRRNNNRYDANHGYRTQAQSEPRDGASPSRDAEPQNSGGLQTSKRRHRKTSGDENSSSSQFDKDHANSDADEDRTKGGLLTLGDVGSVTTVGDLAKCLPVVWSGALVLKNSAFAARMHLVSGDVHIVDTLMRDPTTTEMPVLRITQRLRLDPSKLDEVSRRTTLSGANGHSILLAMPGASNALEDQSNTTLLQRPLRNIVSYLKQKEAAGVIALPPNPSKDRTNVGVLHAFPPCQFGNNYLSACAQKLNFESAKEDYLVVVVVRGAN